MSVDQFTANGTIHEELAPYEAAVVLWSRAEAEEADARITVKHTDLRAEVMEFAKHEGWRALGFESPHAWWKTKEIPVPQTTFFRWIGQVQATLPSGISHVGNSPKRGRPRGSTKPKPEPTSPQVVETPVAPAPSDPAVDSPEWAMEHLRQFSRVRSRLTPTAVLQTLPDPQAAVGYFEWLSQWAANVAGLCKQQPSRDVVRERFTD